MDILKVGAQNGLEPHFLDHLWTLVKGNEVAHLLWICVYIKFGKYVWRGYSVYSSLYKRESQTVLSKLTSNFLLLKDINKYSTFSMLPKDISHRFLTI